MRRYQFLTVLLVSTLLSCKSTPDKNLKYIDQNKPSAEPSLFAENFISKKDVAEFGSVFNKEGNEFFFAIDSAGKAKILTTQLVNDKWEEVHTIIEHDSYSFNDPFLSPDESKLFYISDKPKSKSDTIQDYDIWYSQREGNTWSEPINAGPSINTDANEYYISFTQNGSMYFASNYKTIDSRKHDFDIYKSVFEKGMFKPAHALSNAVNTKRYEADVFIAPDESYIIFCSARKEGLGRGDLYVSFKNTNNEWTEAINMGNKINSEHHEICPFVSHDNKFLFYTSNQDIYWVGTEILEELRLSSK